MSNTTNETQGKNLDKNAASDSTTDSANDVGLLNQVVEIIFSALNLRHIDRSTVGPETPITKGGLNLDSIDILELVVQFEKKFNFKFQEGETYTQHFRNIGTLTEFIQSKKDTL